MKLLSIYRAFVCNQIRSSSFYEQKAVDLIKKDIFTNTDLISSIDIMQGNVITVQVSMIKQKGKILNSKRDKILKFYGYNPMEKERVEIIEDLMPKYFSKVHSQLMSNVIVKGYSPYFNNNLHTFSIDKQGYIFPINLKIDYLNTISDDFLLNGCIQKYTNVNNYILFDSKGFIQGMSEQIYQSIFNFQKIIEDSPRKYKVNGIEKMKLDQVIDKVNIFFLMPSIFQYIQSQNTNHKIKSFLSFKSTDGQQITQTSQPPESILNNQRALLTLPINLKNVINYFSLNSQVNQFQTLSTRLGNKSHTNIEVVEETEEEKIFKSFQIYFEKNKHIWEDSNSLSKLMISFNLQKQKLSYLDKNQQEITQQYYVLEIQDIVEQQINIPRNEDQSTQSNSINTRFIIDEDPENNQATRKNRATSNVFSLNLNNQSSTGDSSQCQQLKNNIQQQQYPHVHVQQIPNIGSTPLINFQKTNEDIENMKNLEDFIDLPSLNKISYKFLNNINNQDNVNHNHNNFQNLVLQKCVIQDITSQSNLQQLESYTMKEEKQQYAEISYENAYYKKNEDDIEQQQQNSQSIENSQEDQYQKNANKRDNIKNYEQESFNENQNQTNNQLNGLNSMSQGDLQALILSQIQSPINKNDKMFSLYNILSPKSPKVDLLPMESLRGNQDDLNQINLPDEEISTGRPLQHSSLAQIEFLESPIRHAKNQNQTITSISDFQLGELSSIGKKRSKNKKKSQITFNVVESQDKVTNVATFWKKLTQNKNQKLTLSFNGVHDIIQDNQSNESKGKQTTIGNKQISDLVCQNQDSLQPNNFNNLLNNNASKKQSLTSLSSSVKSLDNDIIQSIAQRKNLRIINMLKILLSGRLFLIVGLTLAISLISVTQINQLQSELQNTMQFRDDYSIYSQQVLTGIKLNEMNSGVLSPYLVDKYKNSYTLEIEYFGINYLQSTKKNFGFYTDKINKAQESQKDISKVTTLIYVGKQLTGVLQLPLLEYLFYAMNYLLELGQFTSLMNQIGSLYFLIANSLSQSIIFQKINDMINKNLEDALTDLNDQYIFLGIFIMTILVLAFIFGQIFISRLSNYSEKIILLVTKLDSNEVDHEISKLDQCLSYLQQENDQWMQINFSNILYSHRNNTDALNKSNTAIMSNPSKKKVSSKQQKQHQQTNKNKSNSQFSSILQGQSLNLRKFTLMLVSVLILSFIFFAVILIIAYLQSQVLRPSIKLQNKTFQMENTLNRAIVFSEIIASYYTNEDPIYPKLQNEIYLQKQKESMETLKQFSTQFISDFDRIKDSSSQRDELIQLYSEDLCLKYSQEEYCSDKYNEDYAFRRSTVSGGISGLLTRYTQLFNNINNILQQDGNSQQQIIKQDFLTYLNGQDNELLILQGFDLPMKAMRYFLELILTNSINIVSSLRNIILLYYIIFGVIMIVTQIFIDHKIRQQIRQLIFRLNFSLTFIPIVKQQEETTIQMLKAIYNF